MVTTLVSRKLSILALLLLMSGCADGRFSITQDRVDYAIKKWPKANRDSLKEGKNLYISRCSGCHKLIVPQTYSPEKWKEIMEDMSPRAKLNMEEKEKVLHYIATVSRN